MPLTNNGLQLYPTATILLPTGNVKNNADADGLSRFIQFVVIEADTQSAMTETNLLSATVRDPHTVPANPALHIPEDVIRSNSLSSKDWHDALNQDPDMSQVADKLNNGTILAKPMNRELKAYLKELPNIVSIQGVLYKKTRTPGEERLQLLLPENL
ncbi:hypothetical protein DPMN_110546 [Dreissena polymorpha]|uniref:Uncharacterized protein n=1 Tax=Dreissena polymorpha TaxID=45954 RepID=A0A9D4QN06_DREPO|nr:hypothetical protein DPMN_110546 [Dreissena polymorpha]